MISHDRPPRSQTDAISLEFDLQHPPEKVWRTLTDPVLLAKWLLPTVDFGLKPGTKFSFHTDPQPGWDGVVHCQLLDVQELKTISYTWVVGDLRTIVTFTLTPTDTGTRLSLVHSGFASNQKQNLAGARYGWTLMSERLLTLLAESP